jgi:hypothetical protein
MTLTHDRLLLALDKGGVTTTLGFRMREFIPCRTDVSFRFWIGRALMLEALDSIICS